MTAPDARPCDECGKPAERGRDIYVYRRDSPMRSRIGYFGRECHRRTVKALYDDPQTFRVEHRGGRKVRRP